MRSDIMPKSTTYLINILLCIILLILLIWGSNIVVNWFKSQSYHGYVIYNCPKDINIEKMAWFEITERCKIVESVDEKFFRIDESKVKERARDWAKTADYMTNVKVMGEISKPQNTYYKIW